MFKWFTRWFDDMCESAWNRAKQRREKDSIHMAEAINDMGGFKIKGGGDIDMDTVGRMSFELTPAVGGHILTVSRLQKPSQHGGLQIGSGWEKTTYVIASGENIGERVTKIINLEQIK